jgi:hypothetical protein
MPTWTAYQLIHDELNLDGAPGLNCASLLTTWMEPERALAKDRRQVLAAGQGRWGQTAPIC